MRSVNLSIHYARAVLLSQEYVRLYTAAHSFIMFSVDYLLAVWINNEAPFFTQLACSSGMQVSFQYKTVSFI